MIQNGVTNVFILNRTQSLHSQGISEAKWYQMQKKKKKKKGRANITKDIDLTPLKLKTIAHRSTYGRLKIGELSNFLRTR